MFTGLVEELGRVESVEEHAAGRRLWIAATRVLEDARVGDSLSCSGCCLTLVAVEPGRFAVEAVPETLRLTTLGAWRAGTPVNLERSLRLSDRLGGHLVQGHVDGVGEVRAREAEGEGARVSIALPRSLARFVALKGSLAVDGVSLTVAGLADSACEIAYIPHTLAVTSAGAYAQGTRVNLEVDLLARYLARMLEEQGRPS
jgi:riboflavin synthase